MLDFLPAVISTLGVTIALFVAWRNVRESGLRRDDVLAWANEVITTLEGLYLLCSLTEAQADPASKGRLSAIIFDTATLTERGRMFFRNVVVDHHGKEKEPAYRGYRPRILDHIVVAHKVACAWEGAAGETRLRMQLVVRSCLKEFLSLAQQEVGRSRVVSEAAARGGYGSDLDYWLRRVDEDELAHLRRKTTG